MNTGKLTRFFNQTALKAKKYSPEIMLGLGLIGMGGAVFFAIKATANKAEEIIDDHAEAIEQIDTDILDPNEHKKAVVKATGNTAWRLFRAYAPCIGCFVGSATLIIVSHNIQKKRYLGMVAAYATLAEEYSNYRKTVIEDRGEEYDQDCYKKSVVDSQTVNEVANTTINRRYGRIFSKYLPNGQINPNWENDPETNRYFLTLWQSKFNDKLESKGYLFLNEVYRTFKFDETIAGQTVGWIFDEENCIGSNYVDLTITQIDDDEYGNRFLIMPNVDGDILYQTGLKGM